jgi:parvulin-like peptidyl-prolyl isomerase
MQAFYRKHPEFFNRQEKVRIRHIMMATDGSDNISKKGEALVRIQAIQNKIIEGVNFAALALEYSDDSSSVQGGDLGYLERDHIIKPLSAAAFSLKPGEVSDIVETHLGYHLVQLVNRIPTSQLAYRNARTKIERTLRRNKENAATNKYLAKLKSESSIQRLALP